MNKYVLKDIVIAHRYLYIIHIYVIYNMIGDTKNV
tara:strand:- start:259 stop:363 length:105 start_codon:yes stop_codon:yes gene_type:complete